MASRGQILVVDDDEAIVAFVEMALQAEGYDVVVTHDARRALGLLSTYTPDLILLDMRMPEVNGWEFVRAYRSGSTERSPIVIMSAGRDTAKTAAELHADGAIDKPFDIDDLLATVQKHLRGGSS